MNKEKFLNTSISDKEEFKKFCESASSNQFIFESFKQNTVYNEILEHVSFEQGLGYLNEIEKDKKINLSLINKFRENDSIGGPVMYKYPEPYGYISTGTLRYMKVLNDLIILFGDLTDKTIVEIGVGYGGQSKVIRDMFNVKEYNFIDLPEVLKLTKKYLVNFNYDNNIFLDFEDLPLKNYDLVISNYALTECSLDIQDLYIEKIIKKSKNCYITGNDIAEYFGIKNYTKEEFEKKIKNAKFMDEIPQTHHKNYILYF